VRKYGLADRFGLPVEEIQMARPREFDEGAVLDAAIELFWKHGFELTSVRALANSMGMTGASLYNAFGDKRALYRRALERYVDQSFRDWVGRVEGKSPPLESIDRFFNEIAARSLADADRKGCMLINSALEVAPHDPEFQRIVAEVLVQVEAFFFRCISAGQRDGSIQSRDDPADLARTLLGTLLGLRVLARTRPERALLEGMIRPVKTLLAP
jgi:TetR/AcrR family transcriptional repressor of nem operon